MPPVLSAQTESHSKVVECSFVHSRGAPDEALYLRIGQYYHPLEFKKGERAGAISLKRMEACEVYQQVKDRAGGEPRYRFLARAKVPAHLNKVLLLVIAPDQEEGEEYRLLVIDDSIKTFPGSVFLFVNLSGKMLKVDFGGASEYIWADKMVVMPSKVREKGGFVPCIIYDEAGEKYYENRLYSQLTARKVVIVGPPIKPGGSANVLLLSELLPVSTGR